MAVYLYVLRSLTTGLHYVGISIRPAARRRQHDHDHSAGTRGKGPWKEVRRESFPDYTTARAREKFLKTGTGRRPAESTGGVQEGQPG